MLVQVVVSRLLSPVVLVGVVGLVCWSRLSCSVVLVVGSSGGGLVCWSRLSSPAVLVRVVVLGDPWGPLPW